MSHIKNMEEFHSELEVQFSVNSPTISGETVYPPNISDLYSLYRRARISKALAILEFGSGWSTLVLAKALYENRAGFIDSNLFEIRHPNIFKLMTVDCENQFLELSLSRIPDSWEIEVIPILSTAYMSEISGQFCTFYSNLPAFTADFIYLDGPDCGPRQVLGEIDGFNINFGDSYKTYGLPMAGDLIRLEPFLWPGTTILSDGRGANVNFLRTNFRRNWKYEYDKENDQHALYLADDAWGRFSQGLLDFKKSDL